MTNHFLTSNSNLIWLVFVIFMQFTCHVLNGSNPLFPEKKFKKNSNATAKKISLILNKLNMFYVAIKLQAPTKLITM